MQPNVMHLNRRLHTMQAFERFGLRQMLVAALLLWASMANTFAQVPLRYLVNPSFEEPDFSLLCTGGGGGGVPPTRGYLAAPNQPPGAVVNAAAIVPGWATTSTDTFTNTFMCTGVATTIYRPTQIFRGDASGPAQNGLQHAELNPEVESRIYQNICVAPNENFSYSWHHRRRTAGTVESARAVLCRSGAGFTQALECGGVVADTYGVGPVNVSLTPPQWQLLTGNFTASVPAAVTAEFGFESVQPAGSAGNLIDNAAVYMQPLIDFRAPTVNTLAEPGTNNTLTLVVNNATVVIRRTGTAQFGQDYTVGAPTPRGTAAVNSVTGDITLTLPAGNYNPNTATGAEAGVISLPLLVVNDTVIEARETLSFTLANADIAGGGGTTPVGINAPGLQHILSGTSARCAAPTSSVSYQIADEDLPRLDKTFSPSTTLMGQSTTLVFTITSPAETAVATGRATSSPTFSFTDVLPAGIRTAGGVPVLSAGCVGSAPSVAAGSNSIAISGLAVAGGPPAGNGAAAVVCSVSVPVVNSPTFNNPSCATNPSAFTNTSTSVVGVAGATNNVVGTCLVVQPASNLSVAKTDGQTTVTAGTTATYTLTFTNNGPANAPGTIVSDVPSPGLNACTVIQCSPSPTATCPAVFTNFFSSGVALPTFGAGSTVTVRVQCGVSATGVP
jgi:uncharacterized repeat protein (TIGR01451 family)